MRLIEGRNFTGNFGADSLNVILNEAAVKRMRFKEPLNQVISWSLSNAPNRLRVIGVVNDALTNAPFSAAEPTMFVYQPDWTFNIMFRLSPTVSTQAALAKLKPIFNKYKPDILSNIILRMKAMQQNSILKCSSANWQDFRSTCHFYFMSWIIWSCSIYGRATKKRNRYTQSVGCICTEVWLLLSKDFIVLVMISCVIASPIAFYFLQNWLQQYYYRITISPVVFIVSGIAAIIITIITISFQAIKAAIANPVKSLRTE